MIQDEAEIMLEQLHLTGMVLTNVHINYIRVS